MSQLDLWSRFALLGAFDRTADDRDPVGESNPPSKGAP